MQGFIIVQVTVVQFFFFFGCKLVTLHIVDNETGDSVGLVLGYIRPYSFFF